MDRFLRSAAEMLAIGITGVVMFVFVISMFLPLIKLLNDLAVVFLDIGSVAMTFIQMWLFMTNRSEPLRQASLLMLLAGGVGHGDTLLQSLRAHEQESKSIWANKVGQLRMLLEQGHSLSGALSIVSELFARSNGNRNSCCGRHGSSGRCVDG